MEAMRQSGLQMAPTFFFHYESTKHCQLSNEDNVKGKELNVKWKYMTFLTKINQWPFVGHITPFSKQGGINGGRFASILICHQPKRRPIWYAASSNWHKPPAYIYYGNIQRINFKPLLKLPQIYIFLFDSLSQRSWPIQQRDQ